MRVRPQWVMGRGSFIQYNRKLLGYDMKQLQVKLLRSNARLPESKTSGSVGYDVAACLSEPVDIDPGETKMVGSGFSIALEQGYAAFVFARSGLGINHGIVPANCVGVIDSDYRGEIIVGLKNTSGKPFRVNDGDRIAQMVIVRCEKPELCLSGELCETQRGSGGFGSTGK